MKSAHESSRLLWMHSAAVVVCSTIYLVKVRGMATEGSNEADAWQFPLSSGPSVQQQALWHLNFLFLFQKDRPRERLSLIWLLKSSQKAKFLGKLSLSCDGATFTTGWKKGVLAVVKGKQKGIFLCGCLSVLFCVRSVACCEVSCMLFSAANDLQMACFACLLYSQYYFSEENLMRDFFLRRKMTKEGWIPINLISTFNRVKNLTMNLQVIIEVSGPGNDYAHWGQGTTVHMIILYVIQM